MIFGKNRSSGGVEWLLVCLGNPGDPYENTRHNVGFQVADEIAARKDVPVQRLKFRALTNTVELGGAKVLLMKPVTYMNLSGEAAQEAAAFYKVPPERVLVLHTLVVDPAVKGKGYGTAFVRFYEQLGRETGRNCLRIDTNARNTPARTLYARLGYIEAGIIGGSFNGIPGVQLVCLEKTV